jgi:hypothetical protein
MTEPYNRCESADVIRFLRCDAAVSTVEVKQATPDGSKGSARVTLTNGQRFYVRVEVVAPIDLP